MLSSELVPERAGGIAAYTATIAPALASRGHEVHVLSCAPEHSRRDDHANGVWWHRRRLLGGDRAPKLGRFRQSAMRMATSASCRRELGRLGVRFDVIESPEWLAESLFVAATSRVPVVVNLHTPLRILFSYDVETFSPDLRIADRLERAAVARAKLVTSTSELLAKRLAEEGWLRRPVRIVRLPVDTDEWALDVPVRDTEPNILVVGRLEPRKAPEVVVEAAALLASDVQGLKLTFVGRSKGFRQGRPYAQWIAELADRKGVHAEFVNQVPHPRMRDYYGAARVVAVPSHFESFSIAALEAMACGRPIVYSSRVGAAEILRGTPAGTEVPPNDPEETADALRPYLLDPDRATDGGNAALDVVREHCRPDIIAKQRELAFEEALTPNTCKPSR